MYSLIIFLPLIGSIAGGFFGRYVGEKGAAIITTSAMVLSTLFSYTALYNLVVSGNPIYIDLFAWIDSGLFEARWGFTFDSLTVIMLIVVTTVSTLVHLYSTEYMAGDPHVPRFMAYLSLFTFFMLMLVTSNNLIQLFFGWEGVGLASYLLINFWFTRIPANKAAIKAMIVNRVGDFGLSLGILALFFIFKSVDFDTIFALVPHFDGYSMVFFNGTYNIFNVICFLLFIGAVGKSAQIGLHTWLPDAMEGPTPVSALIHAATMVTAGVFLLIRCSALFEYAPDVLLVVTFVGAVTALFAATAGMLQNDLKKVIAYSTCSQLGYMVFACGISNYSVSMFHLMNHAFFKALLFLSAGSVIHAMADEQDMRKMGGIINLLPFTYTMILIGSLSLMGFPFLTGFYSKDVILELAFAKYTITSAFSYWFGTLAAFFTAFYSFRLVYLTFITNTNAYKKIVEHAHDAPIRMAIPLVILLFGTIFVGYLTRDLIIGLGTDFWGNAIFILPSHLNMIDSEFIPWNIKLIPVMFSLTGASMAFILNAFYDRALVDFKLSKLGLRLYGFINKKWYVDNIYNEYIVKNFLAFGYHVSFKTIDRGIIEHIGPYGIVKAVQYFSNVISRLQTGYVYNYTAMTLIGSILFITLIGLWDFLSLYVDHRLYIIMLYIVIVYNYQSSTK
jgi:proton-translocating NADH-quinone oxidoreductase chain L